jgi:hypothetical protein
MCAAEEIVYSLPAATGAQSGCLGIQWLYLAAKGCKIYLNPERPGQPARNSGFTSVVRAQLALECTALLKVWASGGVGHSAAFGPRTGPALLTLSRELQTE